MNTLATRIKSLRLQHDLTQTQLGEILGVQKSAIAKYESGRVTNLKYETIEKICKYFDVSISYLYGTDDERYHEMFPDVPADVVDYIFGGNPNLELIREIANDYVDYKTNGKTSADKLIEMFNTFNQINNN